MSRKRSKAQRDPDRSLARILWLAGTAESNEASEESNEASVVLHDALLEAHDIQIREEQRRALRNLPKGTWQNPLDLVTIKTLASDYAYYIQLAEEVARREGTKRVVSMQRGRLTRTPALSPFVVEMAENAHRRGPNAPGWVPVYVTRAGSWPDEV